MNDKKTRFLKGLRAAALVGVFGLALVAFLIPAGKVSADVTCTAATQPGLSGTVVSDSSSCFIPSGVTVTGATLEYTLDDGGEITIDGNQVFSISPSVGIDSGSKNISTSLFNSGSSFILRVTARNAMDSNGNPVGEVYGEATVRVSTSAIQDNPPSVDLTADNTFLTAGDSTTLRWTTSGNPTSCVASNGWSGSKNVSGGSQSTGTLTSTRTFRIDCSNSAGSDFDTVTVTVGNQTQLPSVDISASPMNINAGSSSTISWTSQNATLCVANTPNFPGGSSQATSGSFNSGDLQNNTTYRITCYNAAEQSDDDSVTVTVNSQVTLPDVDLSTTDASINSGQTTTLIWTVQNASTCTTSGDWSGNVSASGGSTVVGPLFSNKTYNIRCFNSDGEDTDSQTITVGISGQGPDVTTRSATNIDKDEATLRGDVDGNGLSTEVRFEYGRDRDDVEDGDAEDETSWQSTGSGFEDFDDQTDNNLRSDTTYYFRAVARNSRGTDEGSVLSFRTDDDNDNNGDDPSVTIRANPSHVNSGQSSTITWDPSSNTDSCRASGGANSWSGSKSRNGGSQSSGPLFNNTTFSITCENEDGSDTASTTVTVDNFVPNQNRPTVILSADQTSLAYNGATFVRWSTIGATSCQASGGSVGWAGTKSIGPGSFYTGSLSSSRTYTLTCYNSTGSDTDSVTISVRQPPTGGPTPPPASSLVLVTSSIDRNQPILPTLDNTRPRPGDEITYTVNYQNIGTGAIRNLVLRLDLPYEVVYLYSTPSNPIISGNTLIFNLGTLAANGSGTVTVRVRVREDAPPGALLNFPAVLSYTDPAGFPQTVTANVSAQVWNMQPEVIQDTTNLLGAAAFLSGGFWPTSLFGWLLLIILILLLILLAKYLMGGGQPFEGKTTTTTIQH